MKCALVFTGAIGLGLVVLAGFWVGELWPDLVPIASGAPSTATHPLATTAVPPVRDTATPPQGTAPLVVPTHSPVASPTPSRDCTTVFPLESVEAIEFGKTTVPQLEASFGPAVYHGGRAVRLRFGGEECVLFVTIGVQEALEAELVEYGTLDLLLERYGMPGAVGISEGNLTLPVIGSAVLLYPEQGIIAVFDANPQDLTRDATVSRLYFRAAYDVEKQFTRINTRSVVDWQPPLR